AAECADRVARFQVARHDPAVSGLPETVDASGDDGVAPELDRERLVRRVMGHTENGLVGQGAALAGLGEHLVAGGDGLDRPQGGKRADGRAAAEASRVSRSSDKDGYGWAASEGHGGGLRLIIERNVFD